MSSSPWTPLDLPGTASVFGERGSLAGRLFRAAVVVLVPEWG